MNIETISNQKTASDSHKAEICTNKAHLKNKMQCRL